VNPAGSLSRAAYALQLLVFFVLRSELPRTEVVEVLEVGVVLRTESGLAGAVPSSHYARSGA
jgi:hypothetical protein